jgi:hypothetical protein
MGRFSENIHILLLNPLGKRGQLSPTLRATLPTKEKVAPKKEGKKARHIYNIYTGGGGYNTQKESLSLKVLSLSEIVAGN